MNEMDMKMSTQDKGKKR